MEAGAYPGRHASPGLLQTGDNLRVLQALEAAGFAHIPADSYVDRWFLTAVGRKAMVVVEALHAPGKFSRYAQVTLFLSTESLLS